MFLRRLTALVIARREGGRRLERHREGKRERVREGGMLLLPLKLPHFGGELVPRSFGALTKMK